MVCLTPAALSYSLRVMVLNAVTCVSVVPAMKRANCLLSSKAYTIVWSDAKPWPLTLVMLLYSIVGSKGL